MLKAIVYDYLERLGEASTQCRAFISEVRRLPAPLNGARGDKLVDIYRPQHIRTQCGGTKCSTRVLLKILELTAVAGRYQLGFAKVSSVMTTPAVGVRWNNKVRG